MTTERPISEALRPTGPRLSRPVDRQPAEPIDLVALAGPSLAARALPAAAVAVILAMPATSRAKLRWTEALLATGLVTALGRQAQHAARGGS